MAGSPQSQLIHSSRRPVERFRRGAVFAPIDPIDETGVVADVEAACGDGTARPRAASGCVYSRYTRAAVSWNIAARSLAE